MARIPRRPAQGALGVPALRTRRARGEDPVREVDLELTSDGPPGR